MTYLFRLLTSRLALLLDPPERDAVLGDFAESNATPSAAFKEMLGLVLRRHWPSVLRHSFLAVFLLVFCFALSGSSVHLIRSTDRWLWIALESRHLPATQLLESAVVILFFYAILVLQASSVGLTLSVLVPHFLIWLLATVMAVTWASLLYAWRFSFSPLSAVVPTVALLLSFLFGVRYGWRIRAVPVRLAVTYGVAIIACTVTAFWLGGWFRYAMWRMEAIPALLFMNGPIVYLTAAAFHSRRHIAG
ncbi:MAG: hypothetical protein IT168_03785 [Bryobacterales bacterium]|nr:hypothetical protein [Bryobacterales bacterium]